ncbi:MAG: transposon-encoded TnpW family protein [Bacillus sp. (in: firmicutes)]
MAKNKSSNFSYMTRRIGSTTYKVKVVFNENGTETMEDKILRLIRNEVITTAGTCDIINAPQMSRQSERSAS